MEKQNATFIYTTEELVVALKTLAKKLGRTPTARDVEGDENTPSTAPYFERFGSYRNACIAAGLKPNRITREEALQSNSPRNHRENL